jgi:hypothetical protein
MTFAIGPHLGITILFTFMKEIVLQGQHISGAEAFGESGRISCSLLGPLMLESPLEFVSSSILAVYLGQSTLIVIGLKRDYKHPFPEELMGSAS